ncbi:arsenite methyltransferase [Flavihumibacter cheonanensis]|uniref:arsenite methyltransferase n=1 Tax=Flavihumibacter cheonanensis TaxID=1442385 RepID=UPI001EF8052E|nr:arsenite methyltransferase [Flavihumibacter cheonanensis]MCG7752866.1 arsenite methyltransferase [Flavihumibacter cheonanensis]
MQTENELKSLVRERYSAIAEQSTLENASSCCGATSSCCGDEVYSIMADDYTQLKGYAPDADLGLGCGLPTAFAQIKEGDTVIDLGSGAGNDCFVARSAVGEKGKVIGIDFTEKMIEKARANADKLGFNNVEFRLGDIEQMPVAGNTADVVVSNCVLNLVPNKPAVFKEIFRVLKPGAHFSISDIVLDGQLPEKWKAIAELYAGCVSGSIQQSDYLNHIQEAGFKNIKLQKEKLITIPEEILKNYLSEEEIIEYKTGKVAIKSITVYAEKPAACCEPGSGCC